MELSNKLKEQGWHFTEDGIKKLSTTANNDERKIISIAMDMDFREIAGGALPSKREDTIPGRIVLQLQKTRNISAPKSNEESKAAPRFLQLELSDGQSIIQALELESIASLSLNVPPGTKIYFKAERLQLIQGFIVLRASELQVLGGKVEALVEKWEVARTMQKYARSGHRLSGGTSGPPPWIAFGKKLDNIKDTLPNDRNFKSLQAAIEKDKEVKENEEFNTMRSEAIAEATKAGSRKVFGGGGQQILDHNVKKILEKGYSEEEAKQALRTTNNNLERALYNLKRRQEHNVPRNATQNSATTNKTGRNSAPREVGGNKRSGNSNATEDATATKPATNVSLFDFLTDKFPTNTDGNTATKSVPSNNNQQSNQSVPTTSNNYKSEKEKFKPDVTKSNHNSSNKLHESNSSRPKFENNISSSFAANRTGSSTQRSERELNANDRGRSSNFRGSNKGSRGGGHMPYKSNHKMQDDDTRTAPENERNTLRFSGTNNNINSNNNSNNRNNRNSNERSLPPQRNTNNNTNSSANKERNQAADESSRFDNRRNQNYQKSNRGNERHGNSNENKNYERNRQNQKDNSSRKQDDNRTQNMNAANNTVPPTTSTATAAPKATANNNNNSNNNSKTSNNNTDHVSRMNKLVDATSKMKIDKSREQTSNSNQQSTQRQQKNQPQHRTQQQQQQQQTFNQTPSQPQQQQPIISHFVPPRYVQPPIPTAAPNQRNYSQLPYDPSKIIGFQNKQTNDFAMSLLKSQGLSNSMPSAPQAHKPQATSAPPMQPPSPFAANTFVMPNQPASLPPPPNAQYSILSGDAWLFKIGDLCLAKYWDDGRYYEAEITAVADKTCVVFFLGYGNHEEVLKTDCLPITDVNHRPINNYNQMQQQQSVNIAPIQTAPPPPIQTSQRYRAERQMYVPPHKRAN